MSCSLTMPISLLMSARCCICALNRLRTRRTSTQKCTCACVRGREGEEGREGGRKRGREEKREGGREGGSKGGKRERGGSERERVRGGEREREHARARMSISLSACTHARMHACAQVRVTHLLGHPLFQPHTFLPLAIAAAAGRARGPGGSGALSRILLVEQGLETHVRRVGLCVCMCACVGGWADVWVGGCVGG